MLSDLVKIFDKEYKEKGERWIIDGHMPVEGEYILLSPSEENFFIKDRIHIKQDKKTGTIDDTNENIGTIRKLDYMSRYLESNKAISDKNIHSNNYLTFFVKKENLSNGKITTEVIEKYYSVFRNPLEKYTKPKAKKLYLSIEEKLGPPDIERIEKIEAWVKENIFNFSGEAEKDKSSLKLFFLWEEEELYLRESERYVSANIYNSTDYIETIDGKNYGLPNDNMGLNAKKPYLENKTRKVTVPYLLSNEEVMAQKRFFDYLANLLALNKTNIYINEEKGIRGLTNDETLSESFNGYYLRLKKGKEVEIHDFDLVGMYSPELNPPFYMENALAVEESSLQYHTIYNLEELRRLINEVFFNKFLTGNYFTEAKDLSINDGTLKKSLLLSRTALFNWFYKGKRINVWKVLNQESLDLIKAAINNDYPKKASEQFNLRCCLKTYFEGGEKMGDVLFELKNRLRSKINNGDTGFIESDIEYYFAVGQLANYFISLSKSKKKVHSLVNPILNIKTDERLKEELKKLFKKYNYIIEIKYIRIRNLYAMISSYFPNDKRVNEELIIAGYTHSSLIYEESDKEENDNA